MQKFRWITGVLGVGLMLIIALIPVLVYSALEKIFKSRISRRLWANPQIPVQLERITGAIVDAIVRVYLRILFVIYDWMWDLKHSQPSPA